MLESDKQKLVKAIELLRQANDLIDQVKINYRHCRNSVGLYYPLEIIICDISNGAESLNFLMDE